MCTSSMSSPTVPDADEILDPIVVSDDELNASDAPLANELSSTGGNVWMVELSN